MLRCSRCHRENGAARRFCGGCGSAISLPCRRCGFANAEEDRFCGGCGKNLDGSEGPAPAGKPSTGESQGQGIDQLLAEVAAEQENLGEAKKFFDQGELENLFDEDPKPEEKG